MRRWSLLLLLLTQREIHVDNGRHFHRLAVEERRFVEPLLDGFLSRWHQQRVAADQRQVLNRAVLADHGVETNHTLNTSLLGERRIHRPRLANQIRLLHLATDADTLWRSLLLFDRRGRRRRTRHRTDDAADYATGSAPRHAAGNSTHHP